MKQTPLVHPFMCRNVSLGSSDTSNVPRYSDGTEGNSPFLNFVQSDCLLTLQHNVIVVLLFVALQCAYVSEYQSS